MPQPRKRVSYTLLGHVSVQATTERCLGCKQKLAKSFGNPRSHRNKMSRRVAMDDGRSRPGCVSESGPHRTIP